MKRFLSVLIASMFLASAVYAADDMKKADEKKTEGKAEAKDAKDSDKMNDETKKQGFKVSKHPGRWHSPPAFTSYIRPLIH